TPSTRESRLTCQEFLDGSCGPSWRLADRDVGGRCQSRCPSSGPRARAYRQPATDLLGDEESGWRAVIRSVVLGWFWGGVENLLPAGRPRGYNSSGIGRQH